MRISDAAASGWDVGFQFGLSRAGRVLTLLAIGAAAWALWPKPPAFTRTDANWDTESVEGTLTIVTDGTGDPEIALPSSCAAGTVCIDDDSMENGAIVHPAPRRASVRRVVRPYHPPYHPPRIIRGP